VKALAIDKPPYRPFLRGAFHLLKELIIILSFYMCGELIVAILGTAFPGSVVGMLLLLALLHLGWVKIDDIRLVSSLLLSYMPLFFIPAGVSVMASYTLMEGFYWQIILITMVSTLVVMVVTAKSVQYFVKRERL
jgi:holin-like protein